MVKKQSGFAQHLAREIIRRRRIFVKRSELSAGFAHLFLVLALLIIVGVIIFSGLHVKRSKQVTNTTVAANKVVDTDQPLPLKSISFNLDYYNPATNHAGDMVFTHEDHNLSAQFNLIFADFGTQDPRSPGDPSKRNPQPTFILPIGTKVHSLVDGIVVNVQSLYSSDYTIWVSKFENSKYIYETEHVDNPVVKKGDKVLGGQIIGEVSSHDEQIHPGFGIVEIGILHPSAGVAQHICPFHYLDSSIKADIDKKIINVHQAWMNYLGLPNLYDDAHSTEPGCYSLDPVSG